MKTPLSQRLVCSDQLPYKVHSAHIHKGMTKKAFSLKVVEHLMSMGLYPSDVDRADFGEVCQRLVDEMLKTDILYFWFREDA